MIDDILIDINQRMQQAISHVQNELNKVRTGRANPEMFNSLQIDYYGTPTPLNQVSTISVPEPRLITLTPYEKPLLQLIEKSIMDANMGFTPGNNGTSVLVPVPPLSEERRKELAKLAGNYAEQARIAVRNVRKDGMDKLKKMKGINLSEDDHKLYSEEVQSLTDKIIKDIDTSLEVKQDEIMKI